MAQFYPAVMTNAGAALLAQAIAGNAKIQFTTMVSGDGEYSEAERAVSALQTRTSLKSQKQSVAFSSVTVETDTCVHLTGAFSNESLITGYYVREIGLYAKDSLTPSADPILYSITIAEAADYMPPFNGLTPTTIIEEYFTTVDNSASITIEAGGGAYALADDLNAQITKEAAFETKMGNEVLQAWDGLNHTHQAGRDLTVLFADEIADYTDEWAWVQHRLDTHMVLDLRVGDYIPIVVGSENHIAEIAGINTYRKTGDNGHEVLFHIDWITRDCYGTTVQWNTSNVNNGTATENSPFLASNLFDWLTNTLYPLLETKLKNVIKNKRILAPTRYSGEGQLTDDNSWEWKDFGPLWVPLEGEVFDHITWSTKGYGDGQATVYPLFANSYEHRMKGAGPGGSRCYWWLASAYSGSATHACYVNDYGYAYYYGASYATRVPVCFRTMAAS